MTLDERAGPSEVGLRERVGMTPEYQRADALAELLAQLRARALVIGEVTLTSGARADYLIDAKRAILTPRGFLVLGGLVAEQAHTWGATAVGGMTMGADPIACAALAGGAQCKAFLIRKEVKPHGLSRRIEGPPLTPEDRCMLVEDVVTTGGSTLRALEALREDGHQVCGVLAICDRLAGGAQAIERAAGAPFLALTTIDDVYPDRPDRP
ncbi:MAG: orotate phosphoribosyltransferase [Solirubrobacteraceae bacterium]